MYNEKIGHRVTFLMETVSRAKQAFAVSAPVSDLSGGRMGGSLPAVLAALVAMDGGIRPRCVIQ
jgi:hypothetical protein